MFGQSDEVFSLELRDARIATYNSALSAPSSGGLAFTDIVARGDHSTDLSITGLIGLKASPDLFNATEVENSAGYQAGLRSRP